MDSPAPPEASAPGRGLPDDDADAAARALTEATAPLTGKTGLSDLSPPQSSPSSSREPALVTVRAPPSSPMAFVWMAASAVLLALMNFFARLASAHLSWTLVASVRALVGTAVAIAVARVRIAPMTVRNRRGMWWRSAWGTASMICTFYAVTNPALPLGDSVTLLNLTPVFLALLAPLFLKEQAGRRVVVALPLSLLGVVLVLRPAFLFGGAALSRASLGVALVCIAGAVCTSFAMMMLRQLGPRESPEAVAIHFSLFAALVTGLLAARHLVLPSGRDLGWMLAAGVCAGLGQLCMTRAYALERAARVSGMSYLAVVVSALLGATALHEWPDATTVGGMALVIAGGLIITLAGLRDHKPVQDAAPRPTRD